jgi:hypothetical protein
MRQLIDGESNASARRARGLVATKGEKSMESTHKEVAHTSRIWVAKALCFLMILVPGLGTAASARGLDPDLGAAPPVFESYDAGLAVEAENGFDVSLVSGEWRHHGHTHIGGTGVIVSSWGEEMPVRYWSNPDGSFAVEYDGNAILHYSFDELGGLGNVTSVTEDGVRTTFAGQRAARASLGTADPAQFDFSPYEAFLGQIARNHSRGFLDGAAGLSLAIEPAGLAAPAGCVGDILTCTAAILGWIASVPTIAGACTAGAAVTLGASCLGAILSHEAASAATIAACTNAIVSCTDQDDQHGDPGGGCSGPGGGQE